MADEHELCHLIKEESDKNTERIDNDINTLYGLYNNHSVRLNEHSIELNTVNSKVNNNGKATEKLNEVVTKLDDTLTRIEKKIEKQEIKKESDIKSMKFYGVLFLIVYSVMTYGLEKTIDRIIAVIAIL